MARARDDLRALSDRAQRLETKGFMSKSATEPALHPFPNGRLLVIYETANGLF